MTDFTATAASITVNSNATEGFLDDLQLSLPLALIRHKRYCHCQWQFIPNCRAMSRNNNQFAMIFLVQLVEHR